MPSVKKLREEISQMVSENWKKPFGMPILALMEKTFPKKSILTATRMHPWFFPIVGIVKVVSLNS